LRAIGRIGELDRNRIRETFEKRFTARRMAEDYLHYYKALMQQETSDTPLH
jgi:hypothetical protein